MDKKSILVVDDENEIRTSLKWRLEREGFVVTEAENGVAALQVFKAQHFDLVVTDVYMPAGTLDGLGLMKEIKASKPECFVLLMTGFSKILQAKNAFDEGANAFLPKPFRPEELVSLVRSIFKIGTDAEQKEEDFVGISIDEFLSGQKIRYDIYVRILNSRFVRVARKDDVLSVDRVTKYRFKGLKYLHIHRDDYRDYVDFTLGLSETAVKRKLVSPEKAKALAMHSNEVVSTQLCHAEIDQGIFDTASASLFNSVSMISADEDFHLLLTQLNEGQDGLGMHSLGVSLYAVMIAKKVGWESAKLLAQVALAGLFHDIGKKELPASLLAIPRSRMTAEERRTYESHVSRSVEILSDLKAVPEVVIQAVAQHHEELSGTGFPNHLTKKSVCPLAQIIAVADVFTKSVVNPKPELRAGCSETLDKILQFQKEALNLTYVKALASCLKNQEQKTA